ncbi:MAG: rRNA pseudouridine synthase [Candidatus Marinimicrobia bacterium]|nr:rRNA pseudouridine synthase [Candidatus Neomarinimicrobiota bacterium]
MRLNHYLAKAGVASRRKSDLLISEGRISVNGNIVTELGVKIDENSDIIAFDGKSISYDESKAKRYYLLNKPARTLTTVSDDRDRVTIMDYISDPKGLHPVGRLDYNSTGVLIVTNDGELTNRLIHPSNGVERVYVARLDRPIVANDLKKLKDGVILEDGPVNLLRFKQTGRREITLALAEGRNREVKRLFEKIGLKVVRLHRQSFAGISDKGLLKGESRELRKREISDLKSGKNWT